MLYDVNQDLPMNVSAPLLRWSPAWLIALLLLVPAGCARVHVPKPTGSGIQVHDLSDHVDFLTQPGLKGRKCRSMESGYVRQYIRQQFEACKLRPWGKSSSFDLPFGFGTNVVGVLRGSDPALADQVILLCAHYDGLGVQGGKIYPGAADNAAGMAVLLQVAERLASGRHHPRRSIAFAALDCGQERFLGAFAFTMRKDFDPSAIAAVLSLDLLGREDFGVIENALIVVGAERYPEIRQIIKAAAEQTSAPLATNQAATRSATTSQAATRHAATTQATTHSAAATALRIMPAGSDLVPPISNYFALEQWHMPVLFFTNGLYYDYHKPTDTADKLHYDVLQRDADVARRTVRDLANRDRIAAAEAPSHGDREELQAILLTLEEVLAHADELSLTPLERQRLGQVAQRAGQLLTKSDYTLADRKAFILEMIEKSVPSIIRFFSNPPRPDPARAISAQQMASLLSWYEFLASHRTFTAKATQQVVRHFLESRGNLLRLLSSYTLSSCDINPDEIVYAKLRDEQHRLSFIYPHLKVHAGILARDINVDYTAVDCRGTVGDIVDYCLLYWSMDEEECLSPVMSKVLKTVTSRDDGERYRDWLGWRVGQAGASDEAEWLRGLWQTNNADLLKILLKKAAADKKVTVPGEAIARIIKDRRMRPDVRVDAIAAWFAGADKNYLLLLTDVLGHNALLQTRSYIPALDPTFPFYRHVAMREDRLKPISQPSGTVGMAALNRLKSLTGQDFHRDAAAWREWINSKG